MPCTVANPRLQELRRASVLVYANKQDVRGAMTAAELSTQLNLPSLKCSWHIQVPIRAAPVPPCMTERM